MNVPKTIRVDTVDGWVEHPFIWNGEVEQDSHVQAFVVGVDADQLHLAVTHVLDGTIRDAYDRFHTAFVGAPWFSRMPTEYRHLRNIAERAPITQPPKRPDLLPKTSDTPTLSAGDTIHIHSNVYWGTYEGSDALADGPIEDTVCRLPVPTQDVETFFYDRGMYQHRLAQQLVRSAVKRENIDMTSNPRIQPNLPYRPFASGEATRTRAVYGAGEVQDHYVDFSASPAHRALLELNGQTRFGADGTQYLTRNILPFGPGTEDDPLCEVEIHMFSTTVFNPAMGEVQADLVIDGVTYQACKNPEESSHYFEEPGHDLKFGGFRAEGTQFDTAVVTTEQAEALHQRRFAEGRVVTHVLYGNLEEGRMPSDNLADQEAEIDAKVRAMHQQETAANATIRSIDDLPNTATVTGGAPLLIPRSMLDAVEVVFRARE